MSLAPRASLLRRFWWLVPVVFVGLAAWLWVSGLFGLGLSLLNMRQTEAEWRDKGMWLPFYTARAEARPIMGLEDNLSGLTFSSGSGTLFAVINRPPAVAELSTDGAMLRLIPISGAEDPEGITHIAGEVFAISDEGRQRLSWVEIGPQTTQVDLTGTSQLELNYGNFRNMGFEGVSWDSRRNLLFIAQEMLPVRVLMVSGLREAIAGEGFSISVSEWQPGDRFGHFTTDLSSLSVHDATGNMLLLSHMTGTLAEYAPDGRPVSVMPLRAGWHGLKADIPQAEGIAVDDRGDIYLVSEPNLFYRFSRSPALPSALAGVSESGRPTDP